MIENILELIGSISIEGAVPTNVEIKEHYLEGTILYIVLSNYQTLSVDISAYIDVELTREQIEAINNMSCEIDENGNLQINYDDSLLAINFKIDNGDLIAETNTDKLSFNINNNGEMEAIY